jgi:hypothetical protein
MNVKALGGGGFTTLSAGKFRYLKGEGKEAIKTKNRLKILFLDCYRLQVV